MAQPVQGQMHEGVHAGDVGRDFLRGVALLQLWGRCPSAGHSARMLPWAAEVGVWRALVALR